MRHFSTVVMKGGVISMPKGEHVDSDLIPSLKIISLSGLYCSLCNVIVATCIFGLKCHRRGETLGGF